MASAPDLARLALNTATVRRQWSLLQAVEGCARHGLRAIAPWRDQLAEAGVARAARAIRAAGLEVCGLCRGGFFTAPGWRDDNRRAIEEAHAIGAKALVLVVGGLPEGSRDLAGARARVREGIAALLPEARAAGVPLALEPLHPMQAAERACLNTLAQALDLCEALDPEGGGSAPIALGVAVDAYHVWWDPQLEAQLARAGARILGLHLCDWLVPTVDLFNDRGMMGDGVIDLPRLRQAVEAAGYRGAHEVEIFSQRNWWRRDPDEVLATIKERYLRCC